MSSSTSRRLVLLIGVIVGVALTVVAAVVVRTGRSDPKTDDRTPLEITQAFFTSQVTGDVDGMCDAVSPFMRSTMSRCDTGPDDEWLDAVRYLDYTYGEVRIDGDDATVDFTKVDSNPAWPAPMTSTGAVHLVHVDGAWRIERFENGETHAGAPTTT